jgi:hypothetical protein
MNSIQVKKVGSVLGALGIGSVLLGCAVADAPAAANAEDVTVQPWSFVTWQITGVSNGGPAGGGQVSIGNGAHLPVITYQCVNGLTALSWMPAASSWRAQPIVGGAVDHSDIATEGNGVAHVAYVQQGRLYYASTTTRDGTWSASQVDSPELYVVNGLPQPTALQNPCLMVDPAGTPHIAYFVATGYSTASVVEVSRVAGGAWDLKVVENLNGIDPTGKYPTPPLSHAGLACAADGLTGHRELAYGLPWTTTGASIHHAWFNSNGWGTENFAPWLADMSNPAMSAGAGITPAIAWVADDPNLYNGAGKDAVLTLSTYAGAWSSRNLTPGGNVGTLQRPAIATAPDGSHLVLYCMNAGCGISGQCSRSELHLKRELAGSFVDYLLDPNVNSAGPFCTYSAITVDADGRPAIVHGRNGQLYFTTLQ